MHASESRDRVGQWLASLSGPHSGLRLDSEGRCVIAADNGIVLAVSCPDQSQVVVILAPLVNMPIPLGADLYEEILALNLHLEFTGGTQVFFDRQARSLGLLLCCDIGTLDEVSFVNLLTRFKEKAREVNDFMDALLYRPEGIVPASRHASISHAGAPYYVLSGGGP